MAEHTKQVVRKRLARIIPGPVRSERSLDCNAWAFFMFPWSCMAFFLIVFIWAKADSLSSAGSAAATSLPHFLAHISGGTLGHMDFNEEAANLPSITRLLRQTGWLQSSHSGAAGSDNNPFHAASSTSSSAASLYTQLTGASSAGSSISGMQMQHHDGSAAAAGASSAAFPGSLAARHALGVGMLTESQHERAFQQAFGKGAAEAARAAVESSLSGHLPAAQHTTAAGTGAHAASFIQLGEGEEMTVSVSEVPTDGFLSSTGGSLAGEDSAFEWPSFIQLSTGSTVHRLSLGLSTLASSGSLATATTGTGATVSVTEALRSAASAAAMAALRRGEPVPEETAYLLMRTKMARAGTHSQRRQSGGATSGAGDSASASASGEDGVMARLWERVRARNAQENGVASAAASSSTAAAPAAAHTSSAAGTGALARFRFADVSLAASTGTGTTSTASTSSQAGATTGTGATGMVGLMHRLNAWARQPSGWLMGFPHHVEAVGLVIEISATIMAATCLLLVYLTRPGNWRDVRAAIMMGRVRLQVDRTKLKAAAASASDDASASEVVIGNDLRELFYERKLGFSVERKQRNNQATANPLAAHQIMTETLARAKERDALALAADSRGASSDEGHEHEHDDAGAASSASLIGERVCRKCSPIGPVAVGKEDAEMWSDAGISSPPPFVDDEASAGSHSSSASGMPVAGGLPQQGGVPKPDRSHHCRMCGECVLEMDHHCPWVGNVCIGAHNRKYFILLLTYASIALTVFLIWMLPPFLAACSSLADLRRQFVYLFAWFFAAGLWVVVLPFTGFHYMLVARNLTTVEWCEKASALANSAASNGSLSSSGGSASPSYAVNAGVKAEVEGALALAVQHLEAAEEKAKERAARRQAAAAAGSGDDQPAASSSSCSAGDSSVPVQSLYSPGTSDVTDTVKMVLLGSTGTGKGKQQDATGNIRLTDVKDRRLVWLLPDKRLLHLQRDQLYANSASPYNNGLWRNITMVLGVNPLAWALPLTWTVPFRPPYTGYVSGEFAGINKLVEERDKWRDSCVDAAMAALYVELAFAVATGNADEADRLRVMVEEEVRNQRINASIQAGISKQGGGGKGGKGSGSVQMKVAPMVEEEEEEEPEYASASPTTPTPVATASTGSAVVDAAVGNSAGGAADEGVNSEDEDDGEGDRDTGAAQAAASSGSGTIIAVAGGSDAAAAAEPSTASAQ